MNIHELKEISFDNLNFNHTLSNFKTYIENCDFSDTEEVLAMYSAVGDKYFKYFDQFSFDEVIEMFNDMQLHPLNSTHNIGFISFLFKVQFYNKAITIEEATEIHYRYFKPTIANLDPSHSRYSKNGKNTYPKDNEFLYNCLNYKIEDTYDPNSKHEKFFKELIQLIKDLKFHI